MQIHNVIRTRDGWRKTWGVEVNLIVDTAIHATDSSQITTPNLMYKLIFLSAFISALWLFHPLKKLEDDREILTT